MSTHAISDREVARVPARQWDSDLVQGTETTLERRSHGEQYSAADEAGKALPAGNLDVALAAPETARDLAAQGRRAVKAAASGRRAPATRPGALRDLVEEHLRKFPETAFTPHQVGKVLTRSAGAVAIALDKLVSLGVAQMVTDKHDGPGGQPVMVSRGTLDRWRRVYEAGGFDALVPSPRQPSPRTPPGGAGPGGGAEAGEAGADGGAGPADPAAHCGLGAVGPDPAAAVRAPRVAWPAGDQHRTHRSTSSSSRDAHPCGRADERLTMCKWH
jgi:hypothetical protein